MPDSVWILSCGNRDGVADDAIEALRIGGRRVVVVRDLPAACLERDVLFCLSDDERVEIVCHRPRAVRALLESCGRWPGDSRVVWSVPSGGALESERVTTPWYPVIDRQRCTDCGQCHAFCLFGVYSRADQRRVDVSTPLNCKENCPACARLCPEAAVIFPLLDEDPFNGEEVADEQEAAAAARRRQEQMLESDPYRMLTARRAAHKRRLVDPERVAEALAERTKCNEQHGGTAMNTKEME